VGVAAVALGLWSIARGGPGRSAVSPFATAIPVQLTTSGKVNFGLPSPDGSLLAYPEKHCDRSGPCRFDLIVRETDGAGITTLATSVGIALVPTSWSPDGRWLIYAELDFETGLVKESFIVSPRGGSPRRMGTGGMEWSGRFVAADTVLMLVADGRQRWLRSMVASTGQVVDSISLSASGVLGGLQPAPDGSLLLLRETTGLLGDSAALRIVDRRGRTTDSLRLDAQDVAVWGGAPNRLILSRWDQGAEVCVVVQRRLDKRGRLLPAVDTLKVLTDYARILGASADGRQLFYGMTRAGNGSFWTMTRSDARGTFARGRKIETPNNFNAAAIGSLGGKWIVIDERTPGLQWRLSIEPFEGGERHVLEEALQRIPEVAFSPADDSLGLVVAAGGGHLTIRSYPLPSGLPVTRGTYDSAGIVDLHWLSSGLMATPLESRPVVRVFGPHGAVTDFPIPDSLGKVTSVAQSPSAPELAMTFFAPPVKAPGAQEIGGNVSIWRLNLVNGRITPVAQSNGPTEATDSWWTTDGLVQIAFRKNYIGTEPSLYRVPVEGGSLAAEPPLGVDAFVRFMSLARDGRRAVIYQGDFSRDIWVLRAPVKQ